MLPFSRERTRFLLTSLVLGMALGSMQLSAADLAEKPAKPAFTSEQASLLDTLERELLRLDPMLEKVDDPEHKTWVGSKVEKLKKRFQELQQSAFDQTKFDELRFDVNVEYQRLAIWLRPPLAPAKAKTK